MDAEAAYEEIVERGGRHLQEGATSKEGRGGTNSIG